MIAHRRIVITQPSGPGRPLRHGANPAPWRPQVDVGGTTHLAEATGQVPTTTGRGLISWQTGAMVTRLSRKRHWFPVRQPETLQGAAILLYWSAFLGLITGLAVGGAGRYALILTAAGLRGAGLLGLLFEVALVALLVHPRSRDCYRLWYR